MRQIMKTILLTWNPEKGEFPDLEQKIDDVREFAFSAGNWSIVSHKKRRSGDRFFLMRLGKKPKGIMASGYVLTNPFLSKESDGFSKNIYRIKIKFDTILDSKKETLLDVDFLKKKYPEQSIWTPQGSGIEINPKIVDELEQDWFGFSFKSDRLQSLFEKQGDDGKNYAEGGRREVFVKRYERNLYARKKCISYYGTICGVCGFDFYKVYGEIGRDFIHVHHLNLISKKKEEYQIDPVNDLRPVCPNCHAMLHKKVPPFSIKEIVEWIRLEQKEV